MTQFIGHVLWGTEQTTFTFITQDITLNPQSVPLRLLSLVSQSRIHAALQAIGAIATYSLCIQDRDRYDSGIDVQIDSFTHTTRWDRSYGSRWNFYLMKAGGIALSSAWAALQLYGAVQLAKHSSRSWVRIWLALNITWLIFNTASLLREARHVSRMEWTSQCTMIS